MSEKQNNSVVSETDKRVRWSDLVALAYVICISFFVLFLVRNVHSHPFLLAYIKFFFLASFGECLKRRLTRGGWIPERLLARALIWGCFGVWIATSFMILDAGVHRFVGPTSPSIFTAFAISAWMNVFSGYGFFMMLTHFITDRFLDNGFRSPLVYIWEEGFGRWVRIVGLCLVFFWTPAHTITFLLPDTWRILFAAYLGIALGAILSFASDNGRTRERAGG